MSPYGIIMPQRVKKILIVYQNGARWWPSNITYNDISEDQLHVQCMYV